MSIPLPLAYSPKTAIRLALYEGTGAEPIPQPLRGEIIAGLLAKGYPLSIIKPNRPNGPILAGTLVVLGLFHEDKPTEAESTDGVKVYFRSLKDLSSTDVLAVVEATRTDAEVPARKPWKPWFPVIDYDRCTNCMQCLSFCLFDVYAVKDGKINVQNNSKCKTDCPACSRVCPEVAILFPKYRHGPINGDVVSADDIRRENLKVDISSLLGGDIYAALRDRNAKFKSRFNKERDADKALEERQKCLVKLGQLLDVPPELMAGLPTQAQIDAKANAAMAQDGGKQE